MAPTEFSEDRLEVLCRPARPSDTADVIELTRTIWEGSDYVPHVWQEWLDDPQGLLAVAEYQGRVLGLVKLSQFSEQDWWMQGMRVHPDYQGHGIASQLHEFLLKFWMERGGGTVRLATSSKRLPVHHLCEKLGFDKIGERSFFVAPAIPSTPIPEAFTPLLPGEIQAAIDLTLHSPLLTFSDGLIDLGWEYVPPRPVYLDNAVQQGKAWWWQEHTGLVAAWEDWEEEDERWLALQFAACPFESTVACLEDCRRLAGALGYPRLGWMAPLHPLWLPLLEKAGFQNDWDHSLYVFARDHPGHPG